MSVEESEAPEHRSAKWTFTAVNFGRCGMMNWVIDWGDGSTKTEIHGGPRNTVEVFHYYCNSGKYDITITTTDSNGVEATVVMGSHIASRECPVSMVSQNASVQENMLPEEPQITMSGIDETDLLEHDSHELFSDEITFSENVFDGCQTSSETLKKQI